MRASGFQLIELLVTSAILLILAAAATPALLRLASALRVRTGAAEVAGVLRTARSMAIRHGHNVAVKFRTGDGDRVSFTLYEDGDGDGVRTRDIDSGVDPPVGPARDLRHLGRHVRFGFPPGEPPRDPGDPRRRLERLHDPIRFNLSDLASFNPLGGSTPGSVYLTDSRHHLSVVRVLAATGKVKTLSYDARRETWR